MRQAIRRSDYPDTRDEQAMRRFMEGTLNIGHQLTFQRKGTIVNVSPLATERERLSKYFDQRNIHKNDRCVNAKLVFAVAPLRAEEQLCKEPEQQIPPFNTAIISLTPAEPLSHAGRKRNMHMQTHQALPEAPTVRVHGIGLRKGELALLKFVKDCFTFKCDLERDEVEAAARRRPFVQPINPTEHLLSYPADPTRLGNQWLQENTMPTPSNVAFDAQQTILRLQRPAGIHDDDDDEELKFRPNMLVSSFPTQPERSSTTAAHVPCNRYLTTTATPNLHRMPPGMGHDEVVQAGLTASRKIFRTVTDPLSGRRSVPSVPEAQDFLDMERCRLLMRNAQSHSQDIFTAWQEGQMQARRASWTLVSPQRTNVAEEAAHVEATASATSADAATAAAINHPIFDDSGFAAADTAGTDKEGQPAYHEEGGHPYAFDPLMGGQWPAFENGGAAPWHSLSPQHHYSREINYLPPPPPPPPPSTMTTGEDVTMAHPVPSFHFDEDEAQTPRMRAASTLLSLSPIKTFGRSQE